MKRGVVWLFACCLATLAQAGVETGILIQTSPLAGFQYHAGRALFPLMAVGDRLVLVREPDNPHDPRAVRVEWRGAMIGYAPRIDNVDLARLMDNGVPVEGRIVQLQKARDPWKRILFEVLVVEPGR
ncbi:MAG: HIRAN domain-containing protein [Gallionellaceae bacterium]|nr:HIRAN domain-containing protein [Gallionellaceae bacterium]